MRPVARAHEGLRPFVLRGPQHCHSPSCIELIPLHTVSAIITYETAAGAFRPYLGDLARVGPVLVTLRQSRKVQHEPTEVCIVRPQQPSQDQAQHFSQAELRKLTSLSINGKVVRPVSRLRRRPCTTVEAWGIGFTFKHAMANEGSSQGEGPDRRLNRYSRESSWTAPEAKISRSQTADC